VDISSLIVALTGAAALILAQRTKRRGDQRDTVQQAAADELADRDQQWRQRGEVIDNLRQEADRAAAREQDARETATRIAGEAEQRVIAAEQRHHAERERDRRACVAARADLSDALQVLTRVVRDEVARTAAEDAIDRSEDHDRDHHPTD